jgi:hypothetical protein
MFNSSFKFLVDTGASVNLLDEKSYKSIKSSHLPTLHSCDAKIMPYGGGSQIPVIGKFRTRLRRDENSEYKRVEFIVVKGNGGNVLSYHTSVLLGFVNMINTVEYEDILNDHEIEKYRHKYPNLFKAKVGRFKGDPVKLEIAQMTPVQQKLRPVAAHLRGLVKQEIKRMIEDDIIEPCSGNSWLSPVVVVDKEDGSIRICVDARAANQAIVRQRHTAPTLDDLTVELSGAKFFSKIDLKSGYNQIVLHKDSRHITSFSTHIGNFRYKRLVFGLNTAGEIFQKIIFELIKSIKNCMNISDDIIVYGKTQEEHDKALNSLLKTLEEAGLTVNVKKCQFNKHSIKFFGFNFSRDGVHLDHKKYDALQSAKAPQTTTELQSLLGLSSYCSRFIPNYAEITKPLRDLLKSDNYTWGKEQEKAFEQLKKSVIPNSLKFFNKNLKTELVVDASPHGLGAVLLQYDQRTPNDKQIVLYISRALSDQERRYCQMELEGLALVWAVERLHYYLYGIEFNVVTDNSAVQLILKNYKTKPKPRISRWFLRLLPYKFKITHKKSHENIADFFSRNPAEPADNKFEKIAESYIATVRTRNKAISHKEILEETIKDETLIQVGKMLKRETFFDTVDMKPFQKLKDELYIAENGLIMRDSRIILPKSLWKRAIDIAHEGHMGIVKTKQLLRSFVYFPGIDQMVKDKIERCENCKLNTGSTHIEPLRPTANPENPWDQLDIDFYGPIKDGKYLMVIIDALSGYPIVRKISSTAAKFVLPELRTIFAEYGIPHTIKTDNGPPFNSYEYAEFANENDFHHHKVTPYWPRANGKVEHFMKEIKKILTDYKSTELEDILNEFLANYRATPHSTTEVAPHKAIFRTQTTTSKLPKPLKTYPSDLHKEMHENITIKRQQGREYADKNNHARDPMFQVGDIVLRRRRDRRKDNTKFHRDPYEIIAINGNQITIRNTSNEVIYKVNSSELKLDKSARRSSQSNNTALNPIASENENNNLKPNPISNQNYNTNLNANLDSYFNSKSKPNLTSKHNPHRDQQSVSEPVTNQSTNVDSFYDDYWYYHYFTESVPVAQNNMILNANYNNQNQILTYNNNNNNSNPQLATNARISAPNAQSHIGQSSEQLMHSNQIHQHQPLANAIALQPPVQILAQPEPQVEPEAPVAQENLLQQQPQQDRPVAQVAPEIMVHEQPQLNALETPVVPENVNNQQPPQAEPEVLVQPQPPQEQQQAQIEVQVQPDQPNQDQQIIQDDALTALQNNLNNINETEGTANANPVQLTVNPNHQNDEEQQSDDNSNVSNESSAHNSTPILPENIEQDGNNSNTNPVFFNLYGPPTIIDPHVHNQTTSITFNIDNPFSYLNQVNIENTNQRSINLYSTINRHLKMPTTSFFRPKKQSLNQTRYTTASEHESSESNFLKNREEDRQPNSSTSNETDQISKHDSTSNDDTDHQIDRTVEEMFDQDNNNNNNLNNDQDQANQLNINSNQIRPIPNLEDRPIPTTKTTTKKTQLDLDDENILHFRTSNSGSVSFEVANPENGNRPRRNIKRPKTYNVNELSKRN